MIMIPFSGGTPVYNKRRNETYEKQLFASVAVILFITQDFYNDEQILFHFYYVS